MEKVDNSPLTIVIFGASGDLTRRKLIPSLFSLFRKNRLPDQFWIVGYAIDEYNDQKYRDVLRKGLDEFSDASYSDAEWEKFAKHAFYLAGDFGKPEDYTRLVTRLKGLENQSVGRIYYLATPPSFFSTITLQLGQAGLVDQKDGWRRVVIEKPFGSDYHSADELNRILHKVMEEEQIYRIDHYLAKETVQNLLVFRFANTVFEPVWSHKYIDNVQISVLEEVGVEHRAGYYDHAGVLRDMFQNHLLQLLMLVAIEPPDTLKNKDLHKRKLDVLKAIRPVVGNEVTQNSVRGQYKGYREEPGVAPDSKTATYGALRLFIDNKRWNGVPFLLRSGKCLAKKCTEIIIQFTCPPTAVTPLPPGEAITPNLLAACIQPDEGIFIRFEAKVPDTEGDVRSVEMEFHYAESFGSSAIPEAYERLILETIQGDHTLFITDDMTELSWKLIDPIIQGWQGADAPPLEQYDQGSWGPEGADRLIAKNNWEWLVTCGKH